MRLLSAFERIDYPEVINFLIIITIIGNLLMLPIFVGLDFDIEGVESNVVFTLQSILIDNSTLYNNPENFPFSVTQYSPLYYILADGVLTLFSIDAADDYLIRIVGRSLSVAICLVMAMILYNTAKRDIGANKLLSVSLAIAIIAFPLPWYYLTRPDVLLALFYLLFIKTTFNYINRHSFLSAFLMGGLAVLAFCSKQNGVFLMGIGGLFFLYYKDFKGLLYAFFGFTVCALLFIGVYKWAGYEGEYFLENAFEGVNNGIGIRSFLDHTLLAYFSMFGFYTAATMYIIVKLLKQEEPLDKRLFFLLWFTLFLFVFSTLSAIKKGSAINYYNEFLLSTLLIWAFYMRQIASDVSLKWKQRIIVFILLSALFATTFSMRIYTFVNIKEWLNPEQSLQDVRELIDKEIDDDFLYSNVRQVSLKFPGHVVLPQFDIAECCAFPRGVYDYSELCRLIQNGRVKFLILDSRAPESLYGCNVNSQFELYREFDGYYVYRNINHPEW